MPGYPTTFSSDFLVPHSRNAVRLLSAYERGVEVIVVSGNRACAKSSTAWILAHMTALAFPGVKITFARDTFSAINDSLVPTAEKHIFEHPFIDPRNPWTARGGAARLFGLKYDNGSEVTLTGVGDGEKIRGREPDMVIIDEAKHVRTPEALSIILASMGRSSAFTRYGKRHRLVILLTNPDSPVHWIFLRYHPSKHNNPKWEWQEWDLFDNPFYSEDGKTLNADGQHKWDSLLEDHPPGVSRERDVYGRWVSAEGAVFNNFDFTKHAIKKQDLPDMTGKQWDHYRSIDFGIGDPFVCLWGSRNRDNNKLFLHREYRITQTDIDQNAAAIKSYSLEDAYKWTSADHDPGDCMMLNKHGIPTTKAFKDIRKGILLANLRISKDQLYVVEGLSVKDDPNLKQDPKAKMDTLEEIGSYTYKPEKTGAPNDDLPDSKCWDHGIDAMRYMIAGIDRGSIKPPKAKSATVPW